MLDLQTSTKGDNKYRIVKKPYNDTNEGQKTLILTKQELKELAIMIIEKLN